MKSRSIVIGLASVALLGLAASCAGTKLVASWSDPVAKGNKLGTVMVIGIAKNADYRQLYEDQFVKDLAGKHVTAIASYKFMPDAAAINKESAASVVAAQHITHVLVTRLVDVKTAEYRTHASSTYMQGDPSFNPDYYNNWSAYYSFSFNAMNAPGYTISETFMNLESNIYDVATEKMLWSGMTQTETGGDLDSSISKFVAVLMESIGKAGLL